MCVGVIPCVLRPADGRGVSLGLILILVVAPFPLVLLNVLHCGWRSTKASFRQMIDLVNKYIAISLKLLHINDIVSLCIMPRIVVS